MSVNAAVDIHALIAAGRVVEAGTLLAMHGEELPPDIMKKLPRYGPLPVTLLGRLAVDRTAKGQGVGEFLLVDALRRCLEGAQQIGAMAVIVDAKDEQAESFYRHFDFLPFQLTPRRLFLPMRQIAQLFS